MGEILMLRDPLESQTTTDFDFESVTKVLNPMLRLYHMARAILSFEEYSASEVADGHHFGINVMQKRLLHVVDTDTELIVRGLIDQNTQRFLSIQPKLECGTNIGGCETYTTVDKIWARVTPNNFGYDLDMVECFDRHFGALQQV